jgi:hypothetical protein
MYNISASIRGKILPLFYTLLNCKKEKKYIKLFEMLNHIPNFATAEITFDFEPASIKKAS